MLPLDAPEESGADGRLGYAAWNCAQPQFPVLISVPHAGRDYPAELMANLRVDAAHLVKLEDRYADRLATPAAAAGFALIVAQKARAWIDLNRDEHDLDPEMVNDWSASRGHQGSHKMRGGLGLLPRRLASVGELWRNPVGKSDVDARVAGFHRPYHDRISSILTAMRARFGLAILVDLHSMPPLPPSNIASQPDIVVGDRFGQSAAPVYAELISARLRDLGLATALNNPYPGDYVLRRHGQPRRGIHAVQLEIGRQLYLDGNLREPTPELARISGIVAELVFLLADQAIGPSLPMAAE